MGEKKNKNLKDLFIYLFMLVKEMKDIVEIFYFLEIKYSNLNNYSEATRPYPTRPDPTRPNPTNVLLKYGNTENC